MKSEEIFNLFNFDQDKHFKNRCISIGEAVEKAGYVERLSREIINSPNSIYFDLRKVNENITSLKQTISDALSMRKDNPNCSMQKYQIASGIQKLQNTLKFIEEYK